MNKNKQKKPRRKMPPWLVTILYFGCIAIVFGALYGGYRLTHKPQKEEKQPNTMIVEEADGTQKTVVAGEDAFDKDGYVLDENGERFKDSEGNYQNQLAVWAEAFLGAEVDANDFGVDDEGYCYRPSTGERYKTADGREFTDMDAYNGGFSDEEAIK